MDSAAGTGRWSPPITARVRMVRPDSRSNQEPEPEPEPEPEVEYLQKSRPIRMILYGYVAFLLSIIIKYLVNREGMHT